MVTRVVIENKCGMVSCLEVNFEVKIPRYTGTMLPSYKNFQNSTCSQHCLGLLLRSKSS